MDIEALIAFLKELQLNNNKAWFDENRPRYEALRKAFYGDLQQIIDGFADYDAPLRGLKPGDCAFRINKRFPDENGPYKTTFSAAFAQGKRGSNMPSYYLEIDQDGVLAIGGGLYTPTPEELARIREDIDKQPQHITQALDDADLKRVFGGLEAMQAKKAPKGYMENHPRADLIKQKGYVVFKSVDAGAVSERGLPFYAAEHFRATYPLIAYLRRFEVK